MKRGVLIFTVTSIAAFWVNAVGHVWMRARGNPLVRDYKATLDYRSARLGDSLIIPAVNVLLDQQMQAWAMAGDNNKKSVRAPLVIGGAVTAGFHIFQGVKALTNWTMPHPWRWNALGYYHAVYMAAQLSFWAYAAGQVRCRVRGHGWRTLATKRLLASSLLVGLFGRLLYKDYY